VSAPFHETECVYLSLRGLRARCQHTTDSKSLGNKKQQYITGRDNVYERGKKQ
jgi:hypothetical protein